ncbi:MAG: signal peptidase I [Anaerolineae bacterium]|nr:MAG: signal peptidase I [Anaerolineae bacterium]
MEGYKAESDVPTVPTEETLDLRRFLLDVIETVLLSVALYLGINALTARVRVDGFSMLPTLNDGEYVLVNRLAYRLGSPQRGDIIVFRFPINPHQDFIKRVIGLPGEKVEIANGEVYINGARLDETYIAAPPRYSGTWSVPPGYLFVLGDNRNDSSDSHTWGLVPMENVIGKAVLVYWPPTAWAMIDHTQVAVAGP